MKRFLFVLAAAALGVSTMLADETVRELQVRLKKAGFYQAEANGNYDSETSAAVTRYQIRNGLPISGKMDSATLNALHVPPPKSFAASETPATAGVWRRLRNGDMQFVKKPISGGLASSTTPSPVPGRVVDSALAAKPNDRPRFAPHAPPPRLAEDMPSPQSTEPERGTPATPQDPYNPDRLRDYVAAFVLAGLDPEVGAEAEFFANRVNYFGQLNVPREKIRKDLQRYDQRWPQRQFRLAGEIESVSQPDGTVRVTFPLRYDLRNGSKSASGTVRKTITLRRTNDGDLEIVKVSERKST
jgi:putative peptidoglycan binding protein